MAQQYKTGTVQVAAGSTVVRGNGTAWQLALVSGGLFCCQNFSAPVASVVSDSELLLDIPFAGSTTGAAPYSIYRETSAAADVIEANDRLAEMVRRMDAGQHMDPDATGTLADRATYNSEDKGFVFLRTDVTPFQYYAKASNTSGDWAGPSTTQGVKGDPGTPGAPGQNGIGDAYDAVFWDPGRAQAGEIVFKAVFGRAVTFPAGLTNSRAAADVAATGAAAVWSIRRNGVQFGTMTFAIGATTATFAAATATGFVAGDILTLVAPSPRNATLSGISGVLAGNR
jgi:hypothetical protein